MNCGTGTYNLCISQGATFTRIFVWTAGTCCGAGTVGASPLPVDLTGYTAAMQFRAYNSITAPLLYDASADITLAGTAGTITLVIDATDTEGFTWFNAYYDLILTDSSGNVTRLLMGQVTISAAVTA